jgi:RimJ/RimL family protein N-acetyltransferase
LHILLREVRDADLPIFFEDQCDPIAAEMAAFTSRDEDAFYPHWNRILRDATGLARTIVADDMVAGNIVSFVRSGQREIGYWIGRQYWGRGIATEALRQFLALEPERPLWAVVARHNAGSIRVLTKCGFVMTDEDPGPHDASGPPTEECMLRMDEEIP